MQAKINAVDGESPHISCGRNDTPCEYRSVYDDLVMEYDAFMEWTPYYRNVRDIERTILSHALQSRAGDSLLDIGCGTGFASIIAAEHGMSIAGIDPSAGMLRVAEEKLGVAGARKVLLQKRAEELPEFAKPFGVIVAFGSVLNHVDDWETFFEKVGRNSRSGTQLLLTIDNLLGVDSLAWAFYDLTRGLSWGLRDLFKRIKCWCQFRPHFNSWPLETPSGRARVHLRYDRANTVRVLLRRRGFEITETKGANFLTCLSPETVYSAAKLVTAPRSVRYVDTVLARADSRISSLIWQLAGTYVVRATRR